jgi:hypothetical protein
MGLVSEDRQHIHHMTTDFASGQMTPAQRGCTNGDDSTVRCRVGAVSSACSLLGQYVGVLHHLGGIQPTATNCKVLQSRHGV